MDDYNFIDQFYTFEAQVRGSCMAYIEMANGFLLLEVSSFPELHMILENSQVDHIGLRIAATEEGNGFYSRYRGVRDSMSAHGEIVAETIIPRNIGGRPISIVKLHDPLETKIGSVYYVEVPAPRVGRNELEGLDHIEMVLPNEISLAQFVSKYGAYLAEKGLTTVERIFNTKVAIEDGMVNPDLILKTGPFTVKIHERDIGKVIQADLLRQDIIKPLAMSFSEQFPGVMLEN